MQKAVKAVLVAILLVVALPVAAQDLGEWKIFKGDNYRYAEQYAPSWDSRGDEKSDLRLQRFDITYSRKSGWKIFITTRLIPSVDPVRIRVTIDGRNFFFEGASAFGKQSWKADEEFLGAMKRTEQPILVEEIYTGGSGFKYNAIINPDGLAAALKWVGELS